MSEVTFKDYVEHGWKLCLIQRGQKGPRMEGWNVEENAITTVERAIHLESAGLCHAYSGTCAFDIDDLAAATVWLAAKGIDVQALLDAPDAVQIISGRKNRGKLIYGLPTPLPSKTFAEGAFELRCGTSTGRTAQDVLPPSKHPSGSPYEWKGDWKALPPIPEALLLLWRNEVFAPEHKIVDPTASGATVGGSLEGIADILSRKDPNCGYDEWIKIGMAVHHESGGSGAGLELWDKWSFNGRTYPGAQSLMDHWRSFGQSKTPITFESLRKTDVAGADDFDVVEVSDAVVPRFELATQNVAPVRFSFVTLDDLFRRPKPNWIISGVLPAAGLGAFWGQPGGGKTFLAVDTTLAVAAGTSWRGLSTEQGSVLYVAAEDDSGVQARLQAGLAARGLQDAPVRVLPAAPSLMDPKHAKALHEAILAEGRPSIVFIDTLAAVTPGSDENTGKDMSRLIAYCQGVYKATGALVLLVHHEGKSTGKGPRGWSGLHGAFDVEWAVTAEGDRREMTVSKMKNSETGKTYGFRLSKAADSCVVEWL